MVVVDASALVPIARVGGLRYLQETYYPLATTEDVQAEVVRIGKPGTTALMRFFDRVDVSESRDRDRALAEQDGVPFGDAAILSLAERREEPLLAADRALLGVARSLGIQTAWPVTMLFDAMRREIMEAPEADQLLLGLCDEGFNLHPRVYANAQRQIRTLAKSA